MDLDALVTCDLLPWSPWEFATPFVTILPRFKLHLGLLFHLF